MLYQISSEHSANARGLTTAKSAATCIPDITLRLAYELNPNGITFESAKILFDERVSSLKKQQCVGVKKGI